MSFDRNLEETETPVVNFLSKENIYWEAENMIKCPVCNKMETEYRLEKRDFAGNLITAEAPGDAILPETGTDCQLWELYRRHSGDKSGTAGTEKLAAWIAALGYTRMIKHW